MANINLHPITDDYVNINGVLRPITRRFVVGEKEDDTFRILVSVSPETDGEYYILRVYDVSFNIDWGYGATESWPHAQDSTITVDHIYSAPGDYWVTITNVIFSEPYNHGQYPFIFDSYSTNPYAYEIAETLASGRLVNEEVTIINRKEDYIIAITEVLGIGKTIGEELTFEEAES